DIPQAPRMPARLPSRQVTEVGHDAFCSTQSHRELPHISHEQKRGLRAKLGGWRCGTSCGAPTPECSASLYSYLVSSDIAMTPPTRRLSSRELGPSPKRLAWKEQ